MSRAASRGLISRVRVLSPAIDDQELAARAAAGRPEAAGEAVEARFRLNANAARAVGPGAAEEGADRTLAAGAGKLDVAPRGRRQRGEQALGLLRRHASGLVRLIVEAVGEPEVRARRLGETPPQPIGGERRRRERRRRAAKPARRDVAEGRADQRSRRRHRRAGSRR